MYTLFDLAALRRSLAAGASSWLKQEPLHLIQVESRVVKLKPIWVIFATICLVRPRATSVLHPVAVPNMHLAYFSTLGGETGVFGCFGVVVATVVVVCF